jgi:hypothetical protein
LQAILEMLLAGLRANPILIYIINTPLYRERKYYIHEFYILKEQAYLNN